MKGLRLRDALPADCGIILDFCRATWPDYGDYIHRVWRHWISDTGGRLIVADLRGRPVGIGKITEFSPGELWLEGLRVDPKFRRQGIARAINLEVLRTVKRMKPRAVRFCTGMTNRATRRMAEKHGFRVAARLRYYWQKARKAGIRGEFVAKDDIGKVYDFVLNSRFLRLTSGLIAEGWVFREFNRTLLEAYVNENRVALIRRSGAIKGVAIYPFEENDGSLTLGFVDGEEAPIMTLAKNCMYLSRARNLSYCSVAVPSRFYVRWIERAGYRRKDSVGQVVYELLGPDLNRLSAARIK